MSRIQIEQLSVCYGKIEILKNITLEIPDRQIVCIIGPSGCGKTTLLKSMNRLLDLNEDVSVTGNIFVDGSSIFGDDVDVTALRKKVGFLPQRPYPLPMSIFENVAFGPRIHRLDAAHVFPVDGKRGDGPGRSSMRQLVEHYLRLAGLWEEVKDRLDEPAAKLSIGQQQRLALARVLSIEPEVILADEATSALDPLSAKLVEDQFRLLKKDYTIILVTHILRQARRLGDHIVFLYMGDLIESKPAATFFGQPENEKTKAYINGDIS
ncbi:MAG: phosphate ABC transporter ATP-binding protein [Smithellaceae bacterium]